MIENRFLDKERFPGMARKKGSQTMIPEESDTSEVPDEDTGLGSGLDTSANSADAKPHYREPYNFETHGDRALLNAPSGSFGPPPGRIQLVGNFRIQNPNDEFPPPSPSRRGLDQT